jgi:type II secretory pathway component PulC
MQSRSSIIASFILVSLLVVGGVEFFCRSLGDALSVEKKAQLSTSTTDSIVFSAQKQQITGSEKAQKFLVTEDYSIITKRGLFGKVKPLEVPVAQLEPVSEPLQKTTMNLTLLGTISGKGDVQRAIIFDKHAKTQNLYYKGDAVGAAVIKEVQRGKIILTVGGKDEILLMEELHSGDAGINQKPLGSAFVTPLPVPKKITRVERTRAAINDADADEKEKSSGYSSRSVNSVNFQKILNKRKRNK